MINNKLSDSQLISDYIKDENLNDFNIIDLGCGSGRLVKYFDKKFNIKFVGIDFNEKVIKKNLIRFNKKNYKNKFRYFYFT